mmetsp:Transcript_25332/g.79700  ORF Transcript_25332/g.79700 Transcript_25332/m.79700 type:complete len:179 (+) Transcript_25332:26-562(+)
MEFDALLAPTLRPPLHLTLLSPLVTGLRRARRPTHPFVHATPLSLIAGAPPGGLCSRLVSTRALLLVVLVLALPVGGKGCGGKGSGGEGGGGGEAEEEESAAKKAAGNKQGREERAKRRAEGGAAATAGEGARPATKPRAAYSSSAAAPPPEPLSEYEKQRDETKARNQRKLEELGLA